MYACVCDMFLNSFSIFHPKLSSNLGVVSEPPTNLSNNKVTYLDLAITITDNQYYYKSYDKRKHFNFSIINYPDLQSNIPNNPAYGVFTSQIIQYCGTNMRIEDFKKDINELIISSYLRRLLQKYTSYYI